MTSKATVDEFLAGRPGPWRAFHVTRRSSGIRLIGS